MDSFNASSKLYRETRNPAGMPMAQGAGALEYHVAQGEIAIIDKPKNCRLFTTDLTTCTCMTAYDGKKMLLVHADALLNIEQLARVMRKEFSKAKNLRIDVFKSPLSEMGDDVSSYNRTVKALEKAEVTGRFVTHEGAMMMLDYGLNPDGSVTRKTDLAGEDTTINKGVIDKKEVRWEISFLPPFRP